MKTRILLVMLGMVSCAMYVWLTFMQPNTPTDQLRRGRMVWARNRLAHYRFRLDVGCYCLLAMDGPVVVEVRKGAPTSVTSEHGLSESGQDEFSGVDSVEKLFDAVERGIAERIEKIEVSYDSIYGYPTRISLQPNISDSDREYKVTRFEVMR